MKTNRPLEQLQRSLAYIIKPLNHNWRNEASFFSFFGGTVCVCNWLRSCDIPRYSMKHHFCAMEEPGFVCSPLVSSLFLSLTLSLISYLESKVVLQHLVISRYTLQPDLHNTHTHTHAHSCMAGCWMVLKCRQTDCRWTLKHWIKKTLC